MIEPKVAIIVVGWNNEDILDVAFQSVENQTYKNIQTVFWDNNSSDGSVEAIRKKFPWVTIIEHKKNIGFAAANNRVIDMLLPDTEIRHFILLNSDAQLASNWIEEVVSFASKKPKAALVQGKTLDYYDHEIIDSTHVYVAQNAQATQGRWRTLDTGADHPMRIYGVNAAAALVTRDFLEGQPFSYLFDERFFMYLEDVDIAARALVTGWDNYYVPTATAFHMGSASSGKNPGFSLYMTYRNNLPMLVKNYPKRLLLRMLYPMLRSDISTIKRLLRQNRRPAAMKIVQGRIVGFFRLPLYMFSMITMSRSRNVSNEYLWKLMFRGRL